MALTGDEETAQRGIQSLLSAHRDKVDAVLAFNTDGGGVTLKDGRPVGVRSAGEREDLR